jgi:hypothetical protein
MFEIPQVRALVGGVTGWPPFLHLLSGIARACIVVCAALVVALMCLARGRIEAKCRTGVRVIFTTPPGIHKLWESRRWRVGCAMGTNKSPKEPTVEVPLAQYNQEFFIFNKASGEEVVRCHWFLESDKQTPAASKQPDPKGINWKGYSYHQTGRRNPECKHRKVEPAVSGTAPTRTAARQSQPSDVGGGAKAGGVFVGGGQVGQTVPGSHPTHGGKGGRASSLKTNSELTSGKGDFPTESARRTGRSAGSADATGGSGGKITELRQCVAKQRLVSDPLAVPRLGGTARRRSSSRCAISSVSRPAGLPKFNLRGRRYAVPANGCLVTLMRWPCP